MATGPGVYDDDCTVLRESTEAVMAIAIIIGGNKGHGFSAQINGDETKFKELARGIPDLLRSMANTIEKDQKKGIY